MPSPTTNKLAQQSEATISALRSEVHHRDRADSAYTTIERLEKALAGAQITIPRPCDAATSPVRPDHVPTSPSSAGAPHYDPDSEQDWTRGLDFDNLTDRTPPSPSTSPRRQRRRASSASPFPGTPVSPFGRKPEC